MKRIGILSDTHSYWDDRFYKHFEGCSEIWHAGDVGDYSVIERLKSIASVRCVSGNIDGNIVRKEYPELDIFSIDGLKVILTHIGGYPGKYPIGIRKTLEREKPDIFVAGHSHILKVIYDREYSTLFINPGAAGRQGWQTVSTLVLLDIENGAPANCQIIELGKEIR